MYAVGREHRRSSAISVAVNGSATSSDSGRSLWKQALYWASSKQFWTASEGLQPDESSGEDRRLIDRGLPSIPQYRYVGTAYYADLPGHIKRNAVLLGRPPPSDPSSR